MNKKKVLSNLAAILIGAIMIIGIYFILGGLHLVFLQVAFTIFIVVGILILIIYFLFT